MAAYIIVEVETTDEALMAEYRKHTPGAIAKFGGKFIVRGGKTMHARRRLDAVAHRGAGIPRLREGRAFYHSADTTSRCSTCG